jgi:ATP-dependent protease ClpP protease subunit/phage head maturation protease
MGRTMATVTERRAAAELRRRQAGEAGDRGGDAAFRAYRSQAPGVGRARTVAMPSQLRSQSEQRNGKQMIHTSGFFTRYARAYPMWDAFGEYEEVIARGAGRETLAAEPDVAFLVNHKGVTMARTAPTGGREATLLLEERNEGGWHDAWLNPARQDVRDFISAVDDGLITEMSYAFMIPEGKGEWTEDFLTFEIRAYDIDRGDVSGVNYGANPYTDIAAQTPDVLNAIERLPEGALREAAGRLAQRGAEVPATERPARERIEVSHVRRRVDPTASPAVRRLQGRTARTAARFIELAERTGMSIEETLTSQLPWYEIRSQADGGEGVAEPESTDILIYDEIGGSFGVDAKQFAEDLAAITTPTIRLRFNSPGGSVFDGEAIHSSILQHPSRTIGIVDGLAASAASLILMACDEIRVMPAGEIMLHDASMNTQGNAADHGKGQTYLDRHSGHLADIYAARMGTTREVARELMLAETWAFADEAIEMGLADTKGGRGDSLAAGDPGEERMARRHDLTNYQYRHAGRDDAPSPRIYRVQEEPAEYAADAPATFAVGGQAVNRRAEEQRSTVPERKGRSIAYIEAMIDAES